MIFGDVICFINDDLNKQTVFTKLSQLLGYYCASILEKSINLDNEDVQFVLGEGPTRLLVYYNTTELIQDFKPGMYEVCRINIHELLKAFIPSKVVESSETTKMFTNLIVCGYIKNAGWAAKPISSIMVELLQRETEKLKTA